MFPTLPPPACPHTATYWCAPATSPPLHACRSPRLPPGTAYFAPRLALRRGSRDPHTAPPPPSHPHLAGGLAPHAQAAGRRAGRHVDRCSFFWKGGRAAGACHSQPAVTGGLGVAHLYRIPPIPPPACPDGIRSHTTSATSGLLAPTLPLTSHHTFLPMGLPFTCLITAHTPCVSSPVITPAQLCLYILGMGGGLPHLPAYSHPRTAHPHCCIPPTAHLSPPTCPTHRDMLLAGSLGLVAVGWGRHHTCLAHHLPPHACRACPLCPHPSSPAPCPTCCPLTDRVTASAGHMPLPTWPAHHPHGLVAWLHLPAFPCLITTLHTTYLPLPPITLPVPPPALFCLHLCPPACHTTSTPRLPDMGRRRPASFPLDWADQHFPYPYLLWWAPATSPVPTCLPLPSPSLPLDGQREGGPTLPNCLT